MEKNISENKYLLIPSLELRQVTVVYWPKSNIKKKQLPLFKFKSLKGWSAVSLFSISVADSAAVLLPVFLIPQRKITGSDSIEVELEVEGKGEMARMDSC